MYNFDNSINQSKIFPSWFNKFLYIFWVMVFLGTRDHLGMGYAIGYPDVIQETVNKLSLSSLTILFLSTTLFVKFKNYYRIDSFGLSFIILNLIIFILILINPNNGFVTIKDAIFSYDQKSFYTFIIFFSSIFFLPPVIIFEVVKKIFVTGVKLGTILSILALIYYFGGKGFLLFGQRSTIVHADILQILSIIAIVLSILFYTTREKINLLYAGIIIVTIFLSFRRSSFWFFFITLFFITFLFLKNGVIPKKILLYFIVLFTFMTTIIMLWGNDFIDVQYYYQRQLAAFAFLSDQGYAGENIYLTDSNHLEQSLETTKFIGGFLLSNFWGSGIKKSFMESTNYVAGASMGGIHNSIAFVVIRYGTFMLLYYLVLFLIIIRVLIKKRKILSKDVSSFFLYPYIGVLILFFTLLSSWSPTMVTFVFADTNSIVQFVCLFSLIKIVKHHDLKRNF